MWIVKVFPQTCVLHLLETLQTMLIISQRLSILSIYSSGASKMFDYNSGSKINFYQKWVVHWIKMNCLLCFTARLFCFCSNLFRIFYCVKLITGEIFKQYWAIYLLNVSFILLANTKEKSDVQILSFKSKLWYLNLQETNFDTWQAASSLDIEYLFLRYQMIYCPCSLSQWFLRSVSCLSPPDIQAMFDIIW